MTRKNRLTLSIQGRLQQSLPASVFAPSPSRFAMVQDISISMTGDKLRGAKDGILEFSKDAIAIGASVGLIPYNVGVYSPGCLANTKDLDALTTAIEGLYAHSGTAIASAIEAAASSLNADGFTGRRVMVISTDGQDGQPVPAIEAASLAAASGIEIVTIGTPDADRKFLDQLETTGAGSVIVPDHQIAAGFAQQGTRLLLPEQATGAIAL